MSDEQSCPVCGQLNKPGAALCQACSRPLADAAEDENAITREMPRPQILDLFDPAPAKSESGDERPRLLLELVDRPDRRFTAHDGDSIGRRDDESQVRADVQIDGVPEMMKISRQHARFINRMGSWYVQHIGRVNFIIVDGERLQTDELVPLRDNSILVLSTTAFRVKYD